MTVTDEAKLFAIRQQLIEMRYNLDASINIINYVFERDNTPNESVNNDNSSECTDLCDPVTGLYPGQKPNVEELNEEPTVEDIEELCVE